MTVDVDRDHVKALWEDYKLYESKAARDRLIELYVPLARAVANRVAKGMPQNVDKADLMSYGIFGLIDAVDKFDLARSIKFETYAIARIKGAIIDELRSIDWVPRSVRANVRSLENAVASLENSLKRTPTVAELADEMHLSLREIQALHASISFVGVAALDEVLAGADGANQTLGETVPDRSAGTNGLHELEEMKTRLADAIARLVEREKMVLALYYRENLTLAEIGKALGVTESRVCQIHTKAVLQLRTWLRAPEQEPGT